MSVEDFQDLIRAAYEVDGDGFDAILKGEAPGPDFNTDYAILSEECLEEVIEALVNIGEPLDIHS